jgi:hypothetical protein
MYFKLYFWDDDENGEAGRQDEIDPKDPAEKSEIGGDSRSEKRFDFFDSRLPRHQERNQISNFPHTQLDSLWEKMENFNSILLLAYNRVLEYLNVTVV